MSADITDDAIFAFGAACSAGVPSVMDEPVVCMPHILRRYPINKTLFHFRGRRTFGESYLRTAAQKMRVHGHNGLIEHDIEHDVRRLPANAGQRHEFFSCRRNFTAEILRKHSAQSDHMRSLRMIE